MRKPRVAVVGAAETTDLGVIPNMSELMLHADAALNAMAECGLAPKDIDGIATAGETPVTVAHYLGIVPRWADGTGVGGCSFLLHVRHAAAAIEAGYCHTVLVTHGESGRSKLGHNRRRHLPTSLHGQFELPFGMAGPPLSFTVPVMRYLHEAGVGVDALAQVAVVQRRWAGMNPRAFARDPITLDDVLNSKMIAYPFRLLMCCLVTDGGGALILTTPERAKDFPTPPVYILGSGEAVETPMVSQMPDFTRSRAFEISGREAFAQAGITTADVDHFMAYDAFAHLPLYALEAMGFCKFGEAPAFVAEGHTAPGGRLPTNTNGGGLSYMHSGMYGMYAMQESVRQMRGTAAAQVPDAKVSLCHGVGGMFAAAGTIVFTNEPG